MTDTTLSNVTSEFNLSRFMPHDLVELVKFSEYAAKSGVFGQMQPAQALIIMLQGAELGINPLQALREIPLVNGKPRPSATLVAGLIQRSRECEQWSIDSTPYMAVVSAKRRGRDRAEVVIKIEDVPSSLTSKQVWKDNPEDMLVARAIHRMARRHFADILAGIQDPDEIDETRVIDVAKVEKHFWEIGKPIGMRHDCGPVDAQFFLESSSKGGVYMRCNRCGVTAEPPQEVRDAVRGTPEHLTIAGVSEPVLEPGEREVTEHDLIAAGVSEAEHRAESEPMKVWALGQSDEVRELVAQGKHGAALDAANASAVQSESERDTLDGEDVVACSGGGRSRHTHAGARQSGHAPRDLRAVDSPPPHSREDRDARPPRELRLDHRRDLG
jgi:hypothetical protein